MTEEWMLPECKGRTCRWLEKKDLFGSIVYYEHWTSMLTDNRGCYLTELVYSE
jgi:hypothetical protein